MNFQEIAQYIYRRTGHPDSPVTEVATRIKQFINARHREIMTAEGMGDLRQFTFEFASDTTNAEYALPQVITRIIAIHERTNDVPMFRMTLKDYRLFNADPSSFEGTPNWYVELGQSAVAKQPSDASEIFVVSDAAGDTAITPYLEFVQAQIYPRNITGPLLNGVTAVSADTSVKDVTHVTDFYLSAAAVGDVTLLEDSGVGTELARIKIGDTRARYKRIALVPKPESAVTYFVDGEIEIRDMVQNTDEPLIPVDFHWVLAEAALHDEFIKKEKHEEANRALNKHLNGVKALKNYVTNPPDHLPVIGFSRLRGTSRLGPFFPADRIIG